MRYRLRTLLILLAIGPPVLAGVYFTWDDLRPNIVESPITVILDDEGNAYDASGKIIFRVDPSPLPNSN